MRILKKIISCMVIAGLMVDVNSSCIIVNAANHMSKGIRSGETNAANLRQYENEESALVKKLEYDRGVHNTKLSNQLEKKLNEVGLFDNEINMLDEDIVNRIEDSEYTEVSVIYYKEGVSGDKIEMTQEEIDELIVEEIEKGDIEYDERDENIIEKILQSIGIIPIEVKAAKSSHDTKKSPSGALKTYIIASQSKKGEKIYVTYTATWLKEAWYREKDVLGVNTENVVFHKSSIKCDHWATLKTYNGNGTNQKTISKHTQPTNKQVNAKSIAYTVNLFGNRSDMCAWTANDYYQEYVNEFITIQFTCEPNNTTSEDCITIASQYFHWEDNASVTPSISFNAKDLVWE